MNTQQLALRAGAALVGLILLYSAFDQLRTGETYGLAGKGRVSREEEPGYFFMLLAGRIVLGLAGVVLALAIK